MNYWRTRWIPEMRMSDGTTDAELVEAWAKHQWKEAAVLTVEARFRVLGYVLNVVVRAWGTEPDTREYVRSMLNLKSTNSELSKRWPLTAEVAQ